MKSNKELLTISVVVIFLNISCGYFKEKAYSGWHRENWQKNEKVIGVLDIQPGQKIADLGAGAGYFSFQFADRVKETGTVYAVDIDQDMIQLLQAKIKKDNIKNITVVKANPDDSRLPDNTFDLIFLCNSYHSLSDRIAYFRKLKLKMVPGGKLVVIDLKPHGAFGLFGLHGTKEENIIRELKEAGYQLEQSYDFLPEQNFQIFSIISNNL